MHSIEWKPTFSAGHWENDGRKSKIKIKTVIMQQHRPCWNIVRADLGGMPAISPSEHPGGGMSWKDEERLPSETHFSTHLKQAGPDHCFSPPTPSVCKHLSRGHTLWVAHLVRFLWVFLELVWQDEKCNKKKEYDSLFSRTLKMLARYHRAPQVH